MTEAIHYRLYIFGDLHVGSGVGQPGVIDEYVVRDHENFAFLPGSEVKGLLRDSCTTLLRRLGHWKSVCEGQKDWYKMESLMAGVRVEKFCAFQEHDLCVMCALFGSPAGEAGWWFSPANYDKWEYKNLVDDADPGRSLRLVWSDQAMSAHASIDYNTRRAAEKQLFNLEVARPASWWSGQIERVPFPSTLSGESLQPSVSEEHMLGWLTMSILFTRRLGGRRRRGWGRCRFDVSEAVYTENTAALHALEVLLGEISGYGIS